MPFTGFYGVCERYWEHMEVGLHRGDVVKELVNRKG